MRKSSLLLIALLAVATRAHGQDTVRTAPPAAASKQAPRLEMLTGEYELAPGRTLVITLEDGGLHGQPPGSEKRALTHQAETTFSVARSTMTLTFTVDKDGKALELVMRQNGNERTLRKIK